MWHTRCWTILKFIAAPKGILLYIRNCDGTLRHQLTLFKVHAQRHWPSFVSIGIGLSDNWCNSITWHMWRENTIFSIECVACIAHASGCMLKMPFCWEPLEWVEWVEWVKRECVFYGFLLFAIFQAKIYRKISNGKWKFSRNKIKTIADRTCSAICQTVLFAIYV